MQFAIQEVSKNRTAKRVGKIIMGMQSQASRLIEKFDGARRLARLLKLNPSTVYYWEKKGAVPSHQLLKLIKLARLEGIHLSSEDLDPRPIRRKPIPRKRAFDKGIRKQKANRLAKKAAALASSLASAALSASMTPLQQSLATCLQEHHEHLATCFIEHRQEHLQIPKRTTTGIVIKKKRL